MYFMKFYYEFYLTTLEYAIEKGNEKIVQLLKNTQN